MPRKLDPEQTARVIKIIKDARARSTMTPQEMEQYIHEMEAEGLFDDSMDAYPPVEVLRTVDDALTPEALLKFWQSPNPLFLGKSPMELWQSGEHRRVIDFIKSAKGGDMT